MGFCDKEVLMVFFILIRDLYVIIFFKKLVSYFLIIIKIKREFFLKKEKS